MTRIFEEDLNTGFGTRAIHAGQRPDLLSGAIMTPIYTTSTYVQEGLGDNKGYEYAHSIPVTAHSWNTRCGRYQHDGPAQRVGDSHQP